MVRIYTICAIAGGTLFLCQFLLTLMGFGGDHDISGDGGGADLHAGDVGQDVGHHGGHGHGAAWMHGIFTIRAITAAVLFFGVGGLVGEEFHWNAPVSATFATLSGFASAAGVALLMHLILKLQDEGTISIEHAIGQTGTVYLAIPPNRSGFGKVQVDVQNRTAEYQAVTFQDSLPTGAKVVVVDVVSPDTVEVVAAR